MRIDEFEPEAAQAIRTNGKCGDKSFTLREPLHAVRQRQQVACAVRQPHQHSGAQPQHHQVVRMCRQEETHAQQDPGGHGHTLHAEALLKFARHGRGNGQPKTQQAEGERHLAYWRAELIRQGAVKQAPGIDRAQCELGNDGAK